MRPLLVALVLVAATPAPIAPSPPPPPHPHTPTTLPQPATVRTTTQPARTVTVDRPYGYGCRDALATFYGAGEPLNRHAADGSVFDPDAPTVAHRTLPLGTTLLVLHTDDAVRVTVTDRGPAAWTGADVDLAAVGVWDALGLDRNLGRTTVRLCPIDTEGTAR